MSKEAKQTQRFNERREKVQQLHRKGISPSAIAERTGIRPDKVSRYLKDEKKAC